MGMHLRKSAHAECAEMLTSFAHRITGHSEIPGVKLSVGKRNRSSHFDIADRNSVDISNSFYGGRWPAKLVEEGVPNQL
jgi:hypothetical protein